MGMGVGIVASMAADCADKKDLQVIDAEGLFPRSTTWIGYRKNAVLRRYMFDFIQLFASHISPRQLDDIRRATSQQDIDGMFEGSELPLRGGCAEDVVLGERYGAVLRRIVGVAHQAGGTAPLPRVPIGSDPRMADGVGARRRVAGGEQASQCVDVVPDRDAGVLADGSGMATFELPAAWR